MYASKNYLNPAAIPSAGIYAPSSLERIVTSYAIESPAAAVQMYRKPHSGYRPYSSIAEGQPGMFLNSSRPSTPFVGEASELIGHIKEAFALTTCSHLPSDIRITVAPRGQLIQQNIEFLSDSVVGLSLGSTREIFVVSGSLAEVMLTIGHELGHVLAPPARTPHEEEAKAFAFEAAWARSIFEHDIAGLQDSINAAALPPARNGLHDVAFNFVRNNFDIGPLQLFDSISSGAITQEQVFEGLQLQPLVQTAKLPLYSLPQKSRVSYGGYLNKSRVQNLHPPHNFFWSDLGKGIYGMYVPHTTVETLNEPLLRTDIGQMHKTMGHEYSLHQVMGLPDGRVVEALEKAMFWIADECGHYYPSK